MRREATCKLASQRAYGAEAEVMACHSVGVASARMKLAVMP